jgi:hypothetical protein
MKDERDHKKNVDSKEETDQFVHEEHHRLNKCDRSTGSLFQPKASLDTSINTVMGYNHLQTREFMMAGHTPHLPDENIRG